MTFYVARPYYSNRGRVGVGRSLPPFSQIPASPQWGAPECLLRVGRMHDAAAASGRHPQWRLPLEQDDKGLKIKYV